MSDEVILTQSTFETEGPAGFAVAYLKDRETSPVVCLATVDFGTDREERIELQAGQPFEVAGQVWQITEIRRPAEPDWAVVLQRTGNSA